MSNTDTESRSADSLPQQCSAIDCLDELLSWRADTWRLHHGVASLLVPAPRAHTLRARDSAARTLVCHDMRGGYLDDRLCAGWRPGLDKLVSAGGEDAAQYVFHRWPLIDEFVYFSHRLITVPPCGWVQAAHVHGVAILGTLITEGEQGRRVCRRLLSSWDMVSECVSQLVLVSETCGVDGWLVNIENDVDDMADAVDRLVWLLQQLSAGMRRLKPGVSRVLWYDAVVSDSGRVWWQNELNQRNERFFAACDGIFLNYCWNEQRLRDSASLAGPQRLADVYVGVDVFGRGCPGGGGFNTHVAVRAARAAGPLSVAIFAPGWTHEVLGARNFLRNERRFWHRLLDHLPCRFGPCEWPISTDFCIGRGNGVRRGGCEIRPGPWYSPGRQSMQPTYLYLLSAKGDDNDPVCASLPSQPCEAIDNVHGDDSDGDNEMDLLCDVNHYTDDSYSAGCCLAISNKSSVSRAFPLFECSLPVTPNDRLAVVFAVKTLTPVNTVPRHCGMCLFMDIAPVAGDSALVERQVFCSTDQFWQHVLCDSTIVHHWRSAAKRQPSPHVTPHYPVGADVFLSAVEDRCDLVLTSQQLHEPSGWLVCHFLAQLPLSSYDEPIEIRHIGVIAAACSFSLLGLVAVDIC